MQYIKRACRTLLKHKYYTFINVFGLVFGMLPALIIAKYLAGSFQFDAFHKNKDRIYSIVHDEVVEGSHKTGGTSTYSGIARVAAQFSDAAQITGYSMHVRSTVTRDEGDDARVSFVENRIFIADSSFLKVFTFQMLSGDPETALSQPNSIVLTNAMTRKYFGDVNPVGQAFSITVPWGQRTSYTVTGVVEDITNPSQFNFDFLLSGNLTSDEDVWMIPDCTLFLMLNDGASAAGLQEKLNAAMADVDQLRSAGREISVTLSKLGDVRWSGTEYLLMTVGVFVLLAAWVNYMNQAIAQAYGRVKEAGVLRVTGATRGDLRGKFIAEGAITCAAAFILVVVGYMAVHPALRSFTGDRPLGWQDSPAINIAFVTVFIAGVLVTAWITTTILFSQNLGVTLRSSYGTRIGGVTIRKALVGFQFAVSTVLIVSIFVISGQLDYVLSKEKGFTTDGILVVEAPMITDSTWFAKRRALKLLKERYAELPFVTGVTASTTVPGEEYRQEVFLSREDELDKAVIHQCGVDDHFFSVYEMEFIAGRDFIPDAHARNGNSIVLNESAARALGIADYEAAINTMITDHDEGVKYDLVGIVKDFHQTALRYQIKPMAFRYQLLRGHVSLKINGPSWSDYGPDKAMAKVKELFTEIYPLASFETYFLDDRFVREYSGEQFYRSLFTCFTIVSVVISCLGLFGLSVLVSAKRRREIGIRKTFGASSASILRLFVADYLSQLWIAILAGGTVAYMLMDLWLSSYAYRIDIGIGLISTAVLWLVVIFFITIAYHTIRSSYANPAKVLRD